MDRSCLASRGYKDTPWYYGVEQKVKRTILCSFLSTDPRWILGSFGSHDHTRVK